MRRLLLALLLIRTCTFLAPAVPNDTSPILRLGRGNMNAADFSPDDRWFATASQDGELNLWDNWNGSLVRHLAGHTGSVIGVRFSPDGHSLYSLGADATLRRWDVATGQQLLCHTYAPKPQSFDINSSGTRLVLLRDGGLLQLCDPLTGDPLTTVSVVAMHATGTNQARFSPQGNYLLVSPLYLSGSYIFNLRGEVVWSTKISVQNLYMTMDEQFFIYGYCRTNLAGEIIQQYTFPSYSHLAGFLPETNQLVIQDQSDTRYWSPGQQDSDHSLYLMDLDTMTTSVLHGPKHRIIAAKLSHSGELLQAADIDGHIWAWRLADGSVARDFQVHSNEHCYVEFSHDGRKVLISTAEGTAEEYDLQGNLMFTYNPAPWLHIAQEQAASYSDDDQLVGMVSADSHICFWGARTHALLSRTYVPDTKLLSSSFFPGSHESIVYCWSEAPRVLTCNADTHEIKQYGSIDYPHLFLNEDTYLQQESGGSYYPVMAKFHWPDGEKIQSVNLGKGQTIHLSFDFTPDKKTLIACTFEGYIFIIDLPGMVVLKSLSLLPVRQMLCPYFTKCLPDNQRFVVGWSQWGDVPLAEQKEAELRDVRTGNLLQTFDPPGGDYCTGGDVSPDGQYAAIAQGGFTFLFRLPANAARDWGLYP